MTRLETQARVILTAGLGAWVALVAPAGAQAQEGLVVVEFTQAQGDAGTAPLELYADALREDLVAALGVPVVAPLGLDLAELSGATLVTVDVSAGGVAIVVQSPVDTDGERAAQTLSLQGRISHAQVVALLAAMLVPPAPRIPVDSMRLAANPYLDPRLGRYTPPRPIPRQAFLRANPYRAEGEHPLSSGRVPMPLRANPYR